MEAAVDDLATIELESEGPPRHRQRAVALAVAALFVAAVVGVALVAGGGGGKSTSALPKLPATASQPQAAATSDAASNGASGGQSAMYPYRAVQYKVAGTLPELGGKAAAYQLGTTVDPAAAQRLIAAFGMHGTLAAAGGAVQLTDGAKTLSISTTPGLPWFIGSAMSGGGCTSSLDGTTVCSGVAQSGPASVGGSAGSTGSATASAGASAPASSSASAPATTISPGCRPPTCPPGSLCPQYCVKTAPPLPPQRPADLPSQADAEKQARAVLSQAGVNLDGAVVNVQDAFMTWSVEIAPRVGSLPTQGWSWGINIGPRGSIESAHGFLDQPRLLGDYPLAGTTAGLVRLQQSPVIGPGPMLGQGAPNCPAGAMCATGAPAPKGTINQVPQLTVTITGVHLALAWEGQYLAPIYVFEAQNGQVAGIAPAVADGYLQPPNTPSPKTPDNPVPVPQTVPAATPVPGSAPAVSAPCGPQVPPGMKAPDHCMG